MAKYSKGTSGNPAGRPKGIVDSRTALRSLFEPKSRALVSKAIDLGLAGDQTMLRACLDRIVPPIKSKGDPVNLDLEGSPSEQGKAVLEAVGDGIITPDEGATIMQAIASQARIIEVDELEKRIAKLEAQRGNP
jgi:Family of unknown function (DUF5681)